MIENPRAARIRETARLRTRKARSETGLFLVEGPQAVTELLRESPDTVVEVFVTQQSASSLASELEGISRVHLATEKVLEAISDTVNPQGVVAVARQELADWSSVRANSRAESLMFAAILHETRDPGNLGTVIRAADAAGADLVVVSGESVDPFNPKTVRATVGSIFHIPILVEPDLAVSVGALKELGLQVLAADVKGSDLVEFEATGGLCRATAWLFGNEARGLTDEQLGLADISLRLPIFGKAESLNLATAAAICLYESAFALNAR